jgi:type VI secretion system secreted protein VgrG
MIPTQVNRLIGIDTPLGPDVLLLRGFKGQEGISRSFSFELDLVSIDPEIKFEDIIGKRVTLRVTLGSDRKRYFNGFVSRFVQTGSDRGLTNYRATMVSWLWFLTRTSDCRIFQKKTIPDIIEQIFKDLGFTDYKLQLQGKFEPRDYCVQYRETDFNFVSRLMEQYGLFYFFEQEKDKHTLVIANNPSAHQPCADQKTAKWEPQGSKSLAEDVITSWQWEQTLRPGKYAVTDYNYETPNTSLKTEVKSTIEVDGNANYEIFDFPGEYAKKEQGDHLAKIRMEEQEAQYLIVSGTSSCRAFTTGYRFDLKEYMRQDMNQTYVLTNVTHSASVGSTYTTGKSGEDETDYSNSFTCIPHEVVFRPPQITPKPMIQGAQTAVVVGPAGEEIYTDKYGRVKVQFHWDREGKRDEDSSCWIRVSQVHAGKGFGGVDIPRIGEEVIVGFLEGDPDQPIIMGRVYNAVNMPPNGLPAAGMVSGLKSNSTPGGGGNNAMMMDDTKGKEKVSIHAQYNMDTTVENDHSITVVSGNDTHTVSAGTRTVTVKGDTSLTVQAGNRTVDVTGGDYSATSSAAVRLHGKGMGVTINGEALGVAVSGKGGAGVSISGEPNFLASGKAMASLQSPLVVIGNDVITISGTKIVLSTAGGSITLDGAGVSISGNTIKSGATGANEISGGVVKIN